MADLSIAAAMPRRGAVRAGIRAGIAAVVVAVLVGCGGSPRYTYAEGRAMANNAVSAFVASLDPRPSVPRPSDQPDGGACSGIDGDPDGQVQIVMTYDLGVVPVHTSDGWFDQAQRFWAGNGYEALVSRRRAGDVESYGIMSAAQQSTDLALVLERLPRSLGGAMVLTVRTSCVPDPDG